MRVLILCTGNTCRSPMAGGLLRRIASGAGIKVEVRTAGLTPHANTRVAENAITVMREIGIDISDEYSRGVTPEDLGSARDGRTDFPIQVWCAPIAAQYRMVRRWLNATRFARQQTEQTSNA